MGSIQTLTTYVLFVRFAMWYTHIYICSHVGTSISWFFIRHSIAFSRKRLSICSAAYRRLWHKNDDCNPQKIITKIIRTDLIFEHNARCILNRRRHARSISGTTKRKHVHKPNRGISQGWVLKRFPYSWHSFSFSVDRPKNWSHGMRHWHGQTKTSVLTMGRIRKSRQKSNTALREGGSDPIVCSRKASRNDANAKRMTKQPRQTVGLSMHTLNPFPSTRPLRRGVERLHSAYQQGVWAGNAVTECRSNAIRACSR